MFLRYVRKRLKSVEDKLTLRKQTLIIVSVLVVIVVVNQLVIFREFTPGILQAEMIGNAGPDNATADNDDVCAFLHDLFLTWPVTEALVVTKESRFPCLNEVSDSRRARA